MVEKFPERKQTRWNMLQHIFTLFFCLFILWCLLNQVCPRLVGFVFFVCSALPKTRLVAWPLSIMCFLGGFLWHGSGSLIKDQSDHGTSKKLMNPLRSRIPRILWYTMNEWSWITDLDPYHSNKHILFSMVIVRVKALFRLIIVEDTL